MNEVNSSNYDRLSLREKIDYCLEILKNISKKKVLVDGLAGAGKGTLSEKMIEDLGLKRISTGDIYRTITWYLLQRGLTRQNIKELDDAQLQRELVGLKIDFSSMDLGWWVKNPNTGEKQDITDELHSEQIDNNISLIVKRNPIRDIVDQYQREIVKRNSNVFLEGRDMWQVFANVQDVVLIYLYASDEELISRELGRQKDLGNQISRQEAKKRIIDRNIADNNRQRGQLLLPKQVKAGEGKYQLVLDTTKLKPEDVYLRVLEMLCNELAR